MAASRLALDLALILLIRGVCIESVVRLRGLEYPLESGSDVIVTCDGSSADVNFLSYISIYGKRLGEAEQRLVNVVGTLAGVRKSWGPYVQASFRERASFTATMTRERAFIELSIRNLSCLDSGMRLRCKLFGVGVSATSTPRQIRVQAPFTRLYIDGGEFDCGSLTSHSTRMRIGCDGCDRVATRGKATSFSCWGDVNSNLGNNFSISWYRTTWDNSTHQWVTVPLEGVRSNLLTNETAQTSGHNDSDCQLSTLKSTMEYRVRLEEEDMEVTCKITGPSEQGVKILANNTIKVCSVDLEDAPLNVVVTPESIIADIGNSTVFLCKAHEDPPVTYKWFKMVDGSNVSIGGQKSDPGFLQIDRVTKEGTGTYICLAEDGHRSKDVSVQLQYPEPPEISLEDEISILPGVPINLVCGVCASGRVDRLVWPVSDSYRSRYSRYALSRSREVLLQGHEATATLRIGTGRIDIRASGNYSCQTTVHGIEYSKTTYIRVESGVSIPSYSPPSATRMLLGSSHVLTCSPNGSPEPVVTWLFQNSSLMSGAKTVIATRRVAQGKVTSNLQLVNLTRDMLGNYTCHAENRNGIASVDFTILRKGPPAAPIVTLRINQGGQFQLNVKEGADNGGYPASTYIVTYQPFPQGRTHTVTVSAKPASPRVTLYSVRLVNGFSSYSGRVELYNMGAWETICDRRFQTSEAKVVCRQLGLSITNVKVHGAARFGRGTGRVHSGDFSCSGTEAKLTVCRHSRPSSFTRYYYGPAPACGHINDVGVTCGPRNDDHGVTAEIVPRAKVITVNKIVNGHAHYVAVRATNRLGTGETAELLIGT